MKKSKKAATVFEMPVIASEGTTVEVATEPVPTETAAKPEPSAPTDTTEPTPAEPPAATKKRGASPSGLTMASLADRYIASLRDAGKGLGTQFSYQIDLAVAVRHFGADTDVATLTARKVENYFESDAVTKTRTGKPKAKPGIDKTRRVLRLALVWAAEQGLIAEAPIPESALPKRKAAAAE